MSLRNLIRGSRSGKRLMNRVHHDHQFRKVKLVPCPGIFHYDMATKWLDPFDWEILRSFLWVVFLVWIIAMGLLYVFGVRSPAVFAPMFAFFCILFYLLTIAGDTVSALSDFLHDVRYHLGVDNLLAIYRLSPSQLEDTCLKRLRVLATELEKIEKRTMPLDDERSKARLKVEQAHAFFTEYGLIKDTPWQRFFSQPEKKK